MTASALSIDTPRLAAAVEALGPDDINALPFGAIRLDAAGNVTFYSDVERELSGLRKEAIGRAFFQDIAPCFGSMRLRNRIDKALADGTLDVTIDELTQLPSGREADLRIRMLSATGGGCWIFIQEND